MPRPPVRAQHRRPPAGSPRTGRRPQPHRQSSSNAREQLARKLVDKPVGTRPEDSDDSDQLVTKGPGGRRGRFNPIQEIYVSGGVGAGDKPGAHPTRAQRMKSMAKALRSPRASSAASEGPVDRLVNGRASDSPTTNGVVMTAHTTPARDASILEGFKPRKRQLSVLHVSPLDSSTLNLSNDSFALPDDESTPAQVPARQLPNGTPPSSDSAARKRKLGSSEPLSASHQLSTPSLISDTRASGQKRRWPTLDADEVDDDDREIMAPPRSSSSSSDGSSSPPASSPARPISSNSLRKPLRSLSASTRTQTATATAATATAAATTTTQQLQALMPSKRHRGQPTRAKASEFEIPSDASSDPAGEPDESFLPPTKRRGKRLPKKPPPKSLSLSGSLTFPSKATAPKAKSKSKPKSERTLQPIRASRTNIKATTTTTSSSTTPTAKSSSSVLQEQRGPFLGGRKQPDASSPPPGRSSSRGGAKEKARRSGGSRLGSYVSVDSNKNNNHNSDDEAVVVDKENNTLLVESVLDGSSSGGGGSKVVVVSVENKGKKSKWDEIDAFDLQFEDVSVYDRSSEGDAR